MRLKRLVVEALERLGAQVEDVGPADETSVDYPDYARRVAEAVRDGRADRGVLVCGTGIGMSIAANKVAGVRAALVRDSDDAKMSRLHNDANVLVLGGNLSDVDEVNRVIEVWWTTAFEGGRHAKRVAKISEIERANRRGGKRR